VPTKLIVSFALLLAMSVLCWADRPTAAADDAQGVERANTQFYTSLNAMFDGDASPMSQVWSHSADVTYMGPAGGIRTGWELVGPVWKAQADLKLGGEVLPDETHVTVGRDLAIVQCREVGHNLDANGRPLQVSIRATNIFRKEDGEWKMIGHHTDLLPFLDQSLQGR
jgi:ketosteroid isomerase-like protein